MWPVAGVPWPTKAVAAEEAEEFKEVKEVEDRSAAPPHTPMFCPKSAEDVENI